MFTKYKVYKHKNNTDVAFHVTGVRDMHPDGIFLTGHWMRISPMGKLQYLANDSITVRDKDHPHWEEFQEVKE